MEENLDSNFYEKQDNDKTIIIKKINDEIQIIYKSKTNNLEYSNKTNFSKEYYYQNPFEELKSEFNNNQINFEKTKNEDELKMTIEHIGIIHNSQEQINFNSNEIKEITENNINYKIIFYNDNIYIKVSEGNIFKLGNNNLDEDNFDEIYNNIEDKKIKAIKEGNNFKLEIKINISLILNKVKLSETKESFEIFNRLNNFIDGEEKKKIRTDKLIKEIKDKQKTIDTDINSLIKNINVMKSNADTVIFPKKRFKVKCENGVKMDSHIITKVKDFELINNQLINNTFNGEVKYELLYRASEVGDLAKKFKQKCKDVCGTLVVVKTESKNIFGGFTFVAWDDSDQNYEDEKAFCFSIDKKKIYNIKRYLSAVGCDKGSGPRFCDMFMIPNRFMMKEGILFYENQSHYSGQTKDFELADGEEVFYVNELEVFKISLNN